MSMTLLQVVSEFCDRQGLDNPTIVIGTVDDTIRQIRGLANEILTDITSRGASWQKLQKQALFTSVAAENQGLIDTIAPYGFKYIILQSLFDRTDRRPLWGPRTAQRWQESEALPYTGPEYTYRVWQGNFYLQPAPPAGHSCAFEYASDFAIQGPTSVSDPTIIWKKRFTADTDVFALNDDLLLMGLRWKWKAVQSLRYAQEKQDYEALVAQEIGNEPNKGELNMAGGNGDLKPGIWVPSGNWNV